MEPCNKFLCFSLFLPIFLLLLYIHGNLPEKNINSKKKKSKVARKVFIINLLFCQEVDYLSEPDTLDLIEEENQVQYALR